MNTFLQQRDVAQLKHNNEKEQKVFMYKNILSWFEHSCAVGNIWHLAKWHCSTFLSFYAHAASNIFSIHTLNVSLNWLGYVQSNHDNVLFTKTKFDISISWQHGVVSTRFVCPLFSFHAMWLKPLNSPQFAQYFSTFKRHSSTKHQCNIIKLVLLFIITTIFH